MYIQGDYNANSAGGGFTNPSVALRSRRCRHDSLGQLERRQFLRLPFNSLFNRTGATTYVRTAVVSGKQVSFQIPLGITPRSMAARTSVPTAVSTISCVFSNAGMNAEL